MKNRTMLKAFAAMALGTAMIGGSFAFSACKNSDSDSTTLKSHAEYVALDSDDVNDDTSVPTYNDVTSTATEVASPKVVAKTGDGAALENGTVEAVYEFDAANFETKTYADGWTDGIFSILAGTEVRGRIKTNVIYDGDTATDLEYTTVNSVKSGSAGQGISIKIPAAGKLVFYVLNGSNGATTSQTLKITAPSGSKVASTVTYPAAGNDSRIQLVKLDLDVAGEYKIERNSGTSDIYYAKFTCTVNNTPIESISMANTGNVDYLVGQQLDCSEIAVTAKHATTGVISQVKLENVSVDTSKYDASKPGSYEIGVSYTVAGNLSSSVKTFTTSYTVNVYSYESMQLYFDKIVKDDNSAAGNSVYANHSVKQFYFKGEKISTDGLSVKATGALNSTTKVFSLDEAQAKISGDTNTLGKNTIKVEYTLNGLTKAQGFNIYVAEKPAKITSAKTIVLAINPKFAASNVGTVNTAGAYRFKTVKQAMDFLNASGASASAKKYVYIAEGTYWEKVEVTAPNVTFIGAGQDKTKIEYDAVYGETDAGGFTHTTDSTATMNVRDTAVGFKMSNLTVSNYYNTLSSYSTAKTNDQRALAMLIQADEVVLQDCTLLGFQDTLELFTGRQLFVNCLITGTTDYIFGSNNTTYFYKCEIRTVKNGDKGGYCTAFKGNNKGTDVDKVTYGAIFDDCDFTAESGVPKAAGSLGRAWGVDAAVMVMNSRIGAHISAAASINTPGRYISMGNGDPSNAQFKEYNNTGDGAITASLATVTLLSDTEAAKYNDLSVIFGKSNGMLSYKDAWKVTLSDYVTE